MKRTVQGTIRQRREGTFAAHMELESPGFVPNGTAVTVTWDEPEPIHHCAAMPTQLRYRRLSLGSWYVECERNGAWRADRCVEAEEPWCEYCGQALDGPAPDATPPDVTPPDATQAILDAVRDWQRFGKLESARAREVLAGQGMPETVHLLRELADALDADETGS